MALKTIMLRHSIEKKKNELEALRAKDADFQTREADLEKAITEADTPDAETVVNEEVDRFDAEKTAHDQAKADLENDIANMEAELRSVEEAAPQRSAPASSGQKPEERTDHYMFKNINIRSLPLGINAFDSLPMEQRSAIVQRQDVKDFLTRLRGMKGQTRDVSGASLTIPVVFLEMIMENLFRYSKLLNRVRMRPVNGQARQNIMGLIPPAVWMESVGSLNQINLSISQVETDGYKVGGFIPIANSTLEDSDEDLASVIVEALSESIGQALDMAILYGKGSTSRMPLGIVTRLAQTAAPEGYPATAPAWVDLHTSNVITLNSSLDPVDFWAALTIAVGNTYTKYGRGTQFWAMNSKTLQTLRSKLITFTASGDLLARFNGVMPIVDGDVDILEFMPDGDIVGGYGDLYLLALRKGVNIESSREAQFVQDNTVFKGTERADGQPIISGAFVAMNINNVSPTTTMTFPLDTANDAMLSALTIGSESLVPEFDSDTYTYAMTASSASDLIVATPAQANAQVAINYNGENVVNGTTIEWTADNTAHPLTITVTQGNAIRVYTIQVTKAS